VLTSAGPPPPSQGAWKEVEAIEREGSKWIYRDGGNNELLAGWAGALAHHLQHDTPCIIEL